MCPLAAWAVDILEVFVGEAALNAGDAIKAAVEIGRAHV